MKRIGQYICAILILTTISIQGTAFASYSNIVFDDDQITKAKVLLDRLRDVQEQDLPLVYKAHVEHYESSSDPTAQAKELEIILGYIVHMEDLEQILYFARKQEEVGLLLKDPAIITMAKSHLAYSRAVNGEYLSANKEILAIEKEAQESNDLRLQIHIAILRGLMASFTDKNFESFARLRLIERLIVDKPEHDMQRMLLYWALAFNAVNNSELENTLKYYDLSIDVAVANGWAVDRQSTIYNIASLLADAEAFDAAEQYFQEYGEASRDADRDQDVFFMHYGLAGLYMNQNKYLEMHIQAQLALQFEAVPIEFQPFIHRVDTLSLARLGEIEEAKISKAKLDQFYKDHPAYQSSGDEIILLELESEILRAEGKLPEAYELYTKFHKEFVNDLNKDRLSDTLSMGEGLENAIAMEEAENKLAQAEVANSYMFLGGAIIFFFILLIFYTLLNRSAMALRYSKAEADDANIAKSKFLANISHELRTPLNSIIGFSDTLKNERVGPVGERQTQEYSKLINDAGKHLLSIINDILDINKIEAGKMALNEDAIDVVWLLDDINHLLRQTAMKAKIEILFENEDGLPELYGDERQIKQVLINLVNNSIKFSDAGTSITTSAFSRDDGGLTIKVEDEGEGMSEENLRRVMEPFTQIENTIKGPKEGTGLGLPLSKLITELHGGSMNIHSLPAEGTTVEINFPAERTIAGNQTP